MYIKCNNIESATQIWNSMKVIFWWRVQLSFAKQTQHTTYAPNPTSPNLTSPNPDTRQTRHAKPNAPNSAQNLRRQTNTPNSPLLVGFWSTWCCYRNTTIICQVIFSQWWTRFTKWVFAKIHTTYLTFFQIKISHITTHLCRAIPSKKMSQRHCNYGILCATLWNMISLHLIVLWLPVPKVFSFRVKYFFNDPVYHA